VVGIVVLIAVICVGCVAVKGGCATSKPVEKKVLPASTQEKGEKKKEGTEVCSSVSTVREAKTSTEDEIPVIKDRSPFVEKRSTPVFAVTENKGPEIIVVNTSNQTTYFWVNDYGKVELSGKQRAHIPYNGPAEGRLKITRRDGSVEFFTFPYADGRECWLN